MNRSKGIVSSLIALLLFCLVSDTAEARCRKRCRHQRQRQCCTQTCHSHAAPSPCGCSANSYGSTGSQYDSQQSDYSPTPASDQESAGSPQYSNQGSNQNSNQDVNSSQNTGQDSDQNSTSDESEAPLRPGSSNQR